MNILKKISFKRSLKENVAVEISMDWLKIAVAASIGIGKKITKLDIRKTSSFKGNLSKGLAEIFREANIKTEDVLTYLPRHLTTIRILDLPSADKNEIADMVELQAAKQTPYSKEEIITNFKVLGASDKKGYTKVMLVIVRKSIIEEKVKLLREAGLRVKFISLSSEMVVKLYQQVCKVKHIADKDTAVGFIDMNSNFTDFIFIHRQNLVFTRSIFIGVENILAEPQTWKERFINQIHNSLEIYKQENIGAEVGKIIMSASLEKAINISSALRENLNLPVEAIDFIESLQISEEVSKTASLYNSNISFLSCVGTLFIGGEPELNFLPRQMQMERKLEQRSKEIVFSGVLLLSSLMIISGIVAEKIYNQSRFLNMARQEVKKTDKEAGYVEKMKERINIIRKYSDKKNSVLNCLQELYAVIPDEIYLSSFVYNQGKEIVLTGTSDVMSNIFQFVNTIENLDYFEKIKTNYVTKKKREGKEVVDFELICAVAR